jgi:hypothetical protein
MFWAAILVGGFLPDYDVTGDFSSLIEICKMEDAMRSAPELEQALPGARGAGNDAQGNACVVANFWTLLYTIDTGLYADVYIFLFLGPICTTPLRIAHQHVENDVEQHVTLALFTAPCIFSLIIDCAAMHGITKHS